MNTLCFSTTFLLFAVLFHSCLCHNVATDEALIGKNRETLEIIIGGGGGVAPAPSENENCNPPPPPEPECPPPSPPPPPPPPPPSPPPPPIRKPPPPPSPPPPPKPSPPPCPYPTKIGCFESPLLVKSYNVIQAFKLKINTEDPNSKKYTSTWVGTNVCKYKGFSCENRPDNNLKAVAAVDFNGAKLVGKGKNCELPLDGFIDQLNDLAIFHANSNNFTGSVPNIDLKQIPFLYELDLSNNKLSGDFPTKVLAAKNLTFLDLRFNDINGIVRPEVFDLDLDVLFINNNNFEQCLPDNLGDTPALYLTFANNRFTGGIPPSIGRAPNLLEVLFLNNQLTGCLPYEIGYLNQATVFDVGTNKLTGPIPYSFGCLKKIELLNLANNQFYGEVPEIVCKLPKIENFSLSNNYFTQVGPACRDLIMKKKLDVRNNCILDLPSQKSKAECTAFFSKKLFCERKDSFKWVPCIKGGYNYHSNSTEKPDDVQESTASVSSSTTYNTLHRHRL